MTARAALDKMYAAARAAVRNDPNASDQMLEALRAAENIDEPDPAKIRAAWAGHAKLVETLNRIAALEEAKHPEVATIIPAVRMALSDIAAALLELRT